MCGITGFLGFPANAMDPERVLRSMAAAIAHRGPDDEGTWLDAENEIALGHRRLSIVDLSPQGHQPMLSADGRYVMVFNGEIYNFRDIREELELTGIAPAWRGHSDTEVLLAAVSGWGVDAAIPRLSGMFSIALWDRRERSLALIRDRVGEKPLYYGWWRGTFFFASELKALRRWPDWQPEINRDAIAILLRHNYVPAPYSIYHNVYKLMPGAIARISLRDARTGPGEDPFAPLCATAYWSVREAVETGVRHRFAGSEADAVSHLDALLRASVRRQMVADVPLGAFLSGGVDSSTIVALMQAESSRPVKTFTIGFHEEAYDEAKYAKAVARHLRTDHTELYVTPSEAMAVIPQLPELYDEPFSDSSQIPTFLVSRMARQHVTVALSGDAGDELFGGYNRYFWGRALWMRINWMPLWLRHLLAGALTGLSPARWDAFFSSLAPVLPKRIHQRNPGDKMHKLAEILDVQRPEELYHGLVSHWKDPEAIVVDGREPATVLTTPGRWASLRDFSERMMYLDTVSYLPDDILAKVDRAAMGVSLETRIPMLDHSIIEFAWRIPLHMKIRHNQGKWLLRQVLYKYVPRELVQRPKMGFGVPIDAWLRGPLREWAEALLDERRLSEEGYLQPGPVRAVWTEHLSGRRNWQYYLWDVLMFQAWLEQNRPTPGTHA